MERYSLTGPLIIQGENRVGWDVVPTSKAQSTESTLVFSEGSVSWVSGGISQRLWSGLLGQCYHSSRQEETALSGGGVFSNQWRWWERGGWLPNCWPLRATPPTSARQLVCSVQHLQPQAAISMYYEVLGKALRSCCCLDCTEIRL